MSAPTAADRARQVTVTVTATPREHHNRQVVFEAGPCGRAGGDGRCDGDGRSRHDDHPGNGKGSENSMRRRDTEQYHRPARGVNHPLAAS